MPEDYPDAQAAPLLCAGLIGYRSLRMAGDAERLGLYGFGASAHIVCQVARFQRRRVFALTRADDEAAQRFAIEVGRNGPATRSPGRPRSSMRQLSSPPPASWCRPL